MDDSIPRQVKAAEAAECEQIRNTTRAMHDRMFSRREALDASVKPKPKARSRCV